MTRQAFSWTSVELPSQEGPGAVVSAAGRDRPADPAETRARDKGKGRGYVERQEIQHEGLRTFEVEEVDDQD